MNSGGNGKRALMLFVCHFIVSISSRPMTSQLVNATRSSRGLTWSSRNGAFDNEEERLIGWKGEVPRAAPANHLPSPPLVISWRNPRAFLYKKFLTSEETKHLVTIASKRLQRSGVVNNDDGKSFVDNIRTSQGMFFNKAEDQIVQRIEERIALATSIPVGHQEAMQVLRYEYGQKYEAHYDYFLDPVSTRMPSGNRMATFLMYLEDTEEGGETVFPRSAEKPDYDSMQGTFSKCSRMGLSVKPEKGDAVFFWDMKRTDNGPYAPDVNAKLDARGVPSGWALDHTSMHAACPVVRGVKWSAPVWIHSKPFFGPSRNAPNPAVEADMGWGSCLDQFSMCKEWAMKGECESNRAFMVGTAYNKGTGACLKSCNLCTPSIEEELHSLSPKCVDQHDMCEEWATGGQCTENPAFMVGAEGFVGQCMMSCGKCDP